MKLNVSIINLILFVFLSNLALADETNYFWHSDNCPVKTKWFDDFEEPLTLDQKFGPGTQKMTRCLSQTKNVKVVYQLDRSCQDKQCTRPYALKKITNHINDYEITHGMTADDYKMIVLVSEKGWKLVLDNQATKKHSANNPFQAQMEKLVNHPSVKVLFCQNTAHAKGVVKANMINGIGFVTAGISALVDLQAEGYIYIQP
jgi:intracellular sulfur oxidation DsrE/DsrF family protein